MENYLGQIAFWFFFANLALIVIQQLQIRSLVRMVDVLWGHTKLVKNEKPK